MPEENQTALADQIAAGLVKALPDALKPLVSEISANGRIQRPEPVRTVETAIEDVTEGEFADALESGDKSRIAGVFRKSKAADRARTDRELNQIRSVGAAAIGSVAQLAADRLTHYKRFKKEIDAEIEGFRERNPGIVVTPEHYETAHTIIVGRHNEELLAEAREEAIRKRDEPADLSPSGRIIHEAEVKEPESLAEILAGDWRREFRDKNRKGIGRSEDEELRRLGFNGGFKEFLTTRRTMEKIEDETGGTFGLNADWYCKEHDVASCVRCRKANAEGSYIIDAA